eukprot:3460865-Rhodomonas_salina.6
MSVQETTQRVRRKIPQVSCGHRTATAEEDTSTGVVAAWSSWWMRLTRSSGEGRKRPAPISPAPSCIVLGRSGILRVVVERKMEEQEGAEEILLRALTNVQ